MGIIIDGKAGLRVKGSTFELKITIGEIGKLQKSLGAETLMIDTVPLPESPGIIFAMRFKGSFQQFEKLISGLEKLSASVAIETVPLPEKLPMIGTWPTPEKPESQFRWTIGVRSTPGKLN